MVKKKKRNPDDLLSVSGSAAQMEQTNRVMDRFLAPPSAPYRRLPDQAEIKPIKEDQRSTPEPHSPGEAFTPEPPKRSPDESHSPDELHSPGESYSPEEILTTVENVAGYTAIPNLILDSLLPQLTSHQQLVYLRLFRLSHGFKLNHCQVSVQRLADTCQMSDRKVQFCIDNLIKRGLIERLGADFTNTNKQLRGGIYKVNLPRTRESYSPGEYGSSGERHSGDEYHSPIKKDSENKVSKKRFKEIVEQIRQINTGRAGYTFTDLSEDVKRVCAREGIAFDLALFNQLAGVR